MTASREGPVTFSILLPTYNRPGTVGSSVRSAAAQHDGSFVTHPRGGVAARRAGDLS
jgi:hypothetical protein